MNTDAGDRASILGCKRLAFNNLLTTLVSNIHGTESLVKTGSRLRRRVVPILHKISNMGIVSIQQLNEAFPIQRSSGENHVPGFQITSNVNFRNIKAELLR